MPKEPQKAFLQADYTAPAQSAAAVTAGAGDLPTLPTRGLYIAEAGDVTVRMVSGDTVTFTAVPAGTFMPISVDRVTACPANTLALY